jgi:hypothetical protein
MDLKMQTMMRNTRMTKMSEIKFKVWDSRNREMLDSYTIDELVKTAIERKLPVGVHVSLLAKEELDIKEGLIFLRYTGFKDMLDNEIYEGDLLEDNWRLTSDVKFNDYEGRWCVIMSDNGEDRCEMPLSDFLFTNSAEVIGNKHTTQMFTYCHDSKLWKKSV